MPARWVHRVERCRFGPGTEIEYIYNTDGALGFLKDERSVSVKCSTMG